VTGRPGRARADGAAGPARDAGMVTAELAVALPALVLVLALALGVLAVGTARLRCADAARAAVRLAARGESPDAVRTAAERIATGDVTVRVTGTGADVTVEVSTPVRVPGHWLPGVVVTERATEAREPDAVPAGEGTP
jgi:Flp pilus assembly protein TadG